MIFRSKIDLWLILLIIPGILVSASVVVGAFRSQSPWFVASICFLLGILLPVSLLAFTRYEVTSDSILIRSGPFQWTISLASVKKLESSKSMSASPAMSLDRLRIDYERSGTVASILVSPADQEGFREAVQAGQRRALADGKRS
jgi:hypothetical protein